MSNHLILPKDKVLAKQVIDNHSELENKKVDQGWLGMIWGSSNSVPNNIAALLIVILLTTGIIYTFCLIDKTTNQIGLSIKDFWTIISPLVSLAIGYLFGSNSTKSKTRD